MISTSLGTPPNPCFLLSLARISFRETDSFASYAFMSSAAIPEVTRRRSSAWEGPVGVNFFFFSGIVNICSYSQRTCCDCSLNHPHFDTWGLSWSLETMITVYTYLLRNWLIIFREKSLKSCLTTGLCTLTKIYDNPLDFTKYLWKSSRALNMDNVVWKYTNTIFGQYGQLTGSPLQCFSMVLMTWTSRCVRVPTWFDGPHSSIGIVPIWRR